MTMTMMFIIFRSLLNSDHPLLTPVRLINGLSCDLPRLPLKIQDFAFRDLSLTISQG